MLYFNINFSYWMGKCYGEVCREFPDSTHCPLYPHHIAENIFLWFLGSSTPVSRVTTPLPVGSVAWGTPDNQVVVSSSNSMELLLHLMLARVLPWGSRSRNNQNSKFQRNNDSANGLWVFIVRVATLPLLDKWICLFRLVEDRLLTGLGHTASCMTKSNSN